MSNPVKDVENYRRVGTRLRQHGLLAVDPGGTCVGIAYWEQGEGLHPAYVLHLKPNTSLGYLERAFLIGQRIHRLSDTLVPLKAVIEMPVPFSGSGGYAALSANAVGKLSLLSGVIGGALVRKVNSVQWITPLKWKGQLPKEVCAKRVAKLLGYDAIPWLPLDCMDAVGIGLWSKGEIL